MASVRRSGARSKDPTDLRGYDRCWCHRSGCTTAVASRLSTRFGFDSVELGLGWCPALLHKLQGLLYTGFAQLSRAPPHCQPFICKPHNSRYDPAVMRHGAPNFATRIDQDVRRVVPDLTDRDVKPIFYFAIRHPGQAHQRQAGRNQRHCGISGDRIEHSLRLRRQSRLRPALQGPELCPGNRNNVELIRRVIVHWRFPS